MNNLNLTEEIMNALADSELDCATWSDTALNELATIVLRVVINCLTQGNPDALPR